MKVRHADYFCALAEAAEPHLFTAHEHGWYGRVGREYDNLRAAIRTSLDAGRGRTALRIVWSIWRWWQREGLLAEGRWWCDEVVRHPSAQERTTARAKALSAQGAMAYWQGDTAATQVAYREELAVARETDDASSIAWATYDAGFVHVLRGEVDTARALFRESLERFRAVGDDRGTSEALFIVGYTELLARDVDAALPPLAESLQRAGVDWVRRADALIGVGQVHRLRGELPEARRIFAESLALSTERRDMGVAIGALELLAAVDAASGAPERGVMFLGAAEALRDATGGGPPRQMMFLDDSRPTPSRPSGRSASTSCSARAESSRCRAPWTSPSPIEPSLERSRTTRLVESEDDLRPVSGAQRARHQVLRAVRDAAHRKLPLVRQPAEGEREVLRRVRHGDFGGCPPDPGGSEAARHARSNG